MASLAELPSIRKMHWGYQEGWQQFPKQPFESFLKKYKLKIIANYTHRILPSPRTEMLAAAARSWKTHHYTPGSLKPNNMHSTKGFHFGAIVPGLFGRRGERDPLSLKKQNSGLVWVVQGWGDLCAITVKASSLQLSFPAPLSLQLVCQIPTGQEALHCSCWRRNILPCSAW